MGKLSINGSRTVVPNPPFDWAGSKPEWAVYWALEQIGMVMGEDFYYQSNQMGGRLDYGGAVLDFYLPEMRLAINVQSLYYHYHTVNQKVHDAMQRAMLEGWGIKVIYIDEEMANKSPMYYVREALMGRDHSRLGV